MNKNKAAIHEPKPKQGKIDILPVVIQDLKDRSNMGKDKYGTVLQSHNGRDSLMDAYQEALDLVMYLRQALIERDGK